MEDAQTVAKPQSTQQLVIERLWNEIYTQCHTSFRDTLMAHTFIAQLYLNSFGANDTARAVKILLQVLYNTHQSNTSSPLVVLRGLTWSQNSKTMVIFRFRCNTSINLYTNEVRKHVYTNLPSQNPLLCVGVCNKLAEKLHIPI